MTALDDMLAKADEISDEALSRLRRDARIGKAFRELWEMGAPWPVSRIDTGPPELGARSVATITAEYEAWLDGAPDIVRALKAVAEALDEMEREAGATASEVYRLGYGERMEAKADERVAAIDELRAAIERRLVKP